ncbi:glycoside hydrolase family 10 protein [Bacillus massiliigorillae]|uniref:glycoside hydrolase family 10 protein n=1 Tax=Bacillus massiliigorillae TaxID=1243664 RepID=UPI0003A976EA|nr:family 10 glycosylhydrolase [Bacillus massiliigorillae]
MKKRRLFIYSLILMLIMPILSLSGKNTAQAAVVQPKYEMRAAWIATVQNIDMAKGMNKATYTTWARKTLDSLKSKGFNTVIFQVKPTGDALYPSVLAPWSSYITGKKQGTNPGYDPLKIMLDEAHSRGLELHAWVNPYRVTMASEKFTSLAENNVAKMHPEWVVKYRKQYYLNPGIPEVQGYLIQTVLELVSNYDIDAVHMDDYFYPYKIKNEVFADQNTFLKHGTKFSNINDWRRNNVNELVANLNEAIKNVKPWVQFGISPFGVWRNIANDPTGSKTKAGVQNYDDLYADTRQWIKDGSIDYITPQLYWSRSLSVANYTVLLNWWNQEVTTYATKHPVNLYIGLADYKVGTKDDNAWLKQLELPSQIIANRNQKTTQGQMHFSLSDINKNKLNYVTYITKNLYNYKALTPVTAWNNPIVPMQPMKVEAKNEKNGVKITIDHSLDNDARKFVIYRFENNNKVNYDSPISIVDVVYSNNGKATFVDLSAQLKKTYTYGIKSLSATGVESINATTVTVKR